MEWEILGKIRKLDKRVTDKTDANQELGQKEKQL